MALAGRTSRSGGGRRLLIAALIVTILVVLLDASLKSRSPAPAETLSAQAWIDRALPLITSSSAQGRQLSALRTSGLGTPASRITATLDSVVSGAAADYRMALAYGSPPAAGGAPGLLEACLLARSKAAATFADAVTSALRAPTPPASSTAPVVVEAAAAAEQMTVADEAYTLFAGSLPKSLGVTMPASTWLTDPALYQPAPLQVWLVALRNGTSLVPVHQLAVDAVSTNPPPVGVQASTKVQDIPPTHSISVSVVVADTGNQPEPDLTVTVSVSPSAAGAYPSVHGYVSLTAGAASALTLGPLEPLAGRPATLTVTVSALRGSPTPPASATLPIEVAAPPPPTTTTSVPGASGSGSGASGSGSSGSGSGSGASGSGTSVPATTG